jgi:peptide chain release factor
MKSLIFSVTHEKEKMLHDKMEALGIKETDIIERFVRSQGHGGQKVNKTSTCVYLKHIPTGIEVKMPKGTFPGVKPLPCAPYSYKQNTKHGARQRK